MQYRVIKAWQASYSDPIRVQAGAQLHLTGRRDVWDGHIWLWAEADTGHAGWVPDTLVAPDGTAAMAYDALELTCTAGEILTSACQTHGWALCTSGLGIIGWVPLSHLRRV